MILILVDTEDNEGPNALSATRNYNSRSGQSLEESYKVREKKHLS